MRRPLVVASVGAMAGAAVVLGSSVLGGSLELSLLFFIAWALVRWGCRRWAASSCLRIDC